MEWKRITEESPPANDRPIMLGCYRDGWVEQGYRLGEEGPQNGNFYAANTHWTDASDGQLFPTHWAPMPEPPTP